MKHILHKLGSVSQGDPGKMWFIMVSIICVRIGQKKSVPRNHRLSSLGKPLDAKQRSSGRMFLIHLHTHDIFLCFAQLQRLDLKCNSAWIKFDSYADQTARMSLASK